MLLRTEEAVAPPVWRVQAYRRLVAGCDAVHCGERAHDVRAHDATERGVRYAKERDELVRDVPVRARRKRWLRCGVRRRQDSTADLDG